MKVSNWMHCVGSVLLVQSLSTSNCNLIVNPLTKKTREKREYLNVGDEYKFEDANNAISLTANIEIGNQLDDNINEKESVAQGRFMASYFFPLFPQFYDVDYNGVWNWLKRADTIGYFLFENVSDVCNILLHLTVDTQNISLL